MKVDNLQGASSDSNAENEATNTNTCPHVGTSVKKTGKNALPKECMDCARNERQRKSSTLATRVENGDDNVDEDEDDIYICLKCGLARCKEHSKSHSTNSHDPHKVAFNHVKRVVWCFECEKELPENISRKLQEVVGYLLKASKTNNTIVDDTESAQAAGTGKDLDTETTKYTGSFTIAKVPADPLPPVRGLTNLGNTCYFNSVLQCLAQTPFLLPILEEMRECGETFELPGGEIKFGEDKMTLDPLKGWLDPLKEETLTNELINTLRELQSGKGGSFVPRELKKILEKDCHQFAGYAQHDSHELLRQLLESVRNEDFQRYKLAILKELNLNNKSNRVNISSERTRAVKAYGRQAGDLLLRPSQVFRGELVSTLQRLSCLHTSDHVEHFLDLSLPVAADKPSHQRRRANSETNDGISKHQLKMERKKANKRGRKSKKSYQHSGPFSNDNKLDENENVDGSSASEDDSDADNEEEAEPTPARSSEVNESGYSSEKLANGDSGCGSPSSSELTGLLDENSSLLRNTPGVTGGGSISGHINAGPGSSPESQPPRRYHETSPVEDGEGAASFAAQKPRKKPENLNLSLPRVIALPSPSSPTDFDPQSYPSNKLRSDFTKMVVGEEGGADCSPDSESAGIKAGCAEAPADTPLDSEGHGECAGAVSPPSSVDADDYDAAAGKFVAEELEDVEKTLAPRVITSSNQCTLITCLNNFTTVELLTNNNKVSCDDCTEKLSRGGKPAKTVYADASKQLLILTPPAILILHLKRFQVQRFASRKNCETVTFDPILDLAPYCSVKCKNSGLVQKDQSEIRYSLYGVVQHSGGMHGGHYVAHVKVRKALERDDPRWAFLPQGPSKTGSLSNMTSEPPGPPPGKWYHVSDCHVSEEKEPRVLSSEAYLLFYERIW